MNLVLNNSPVFAWFSKVTRSREHQQSIPKKITESFENKTGPGVLQFSVLQTERTKLKHNHNQNFVPSIFLYGHVCRMLEWNTPGPISFSNSQDYVITLLSECSITTA